MIELVGLSFAESPLIPALIGAFASITVGIMATRGMAKREAKAAGTDAAQGVIAAQAKRIENLEGRNDELVKRVGKLEGEVARLDKTVNGH